MTVAGWTQHKSPSVKSARPFGHFRSLSSFTSPGAATKTADATVGHHHRSPSLSDLPPKMSADVAYASTFLGPAHNSKTPSPTSATPRNFDDSQDLNTLPDPRSRAMSPASAHGFPSPISPVSDLDQEVATLSTKLINAINHQTTLDDTLSRARAELEDARETIRQLEGRLAEQREMLSGDVWVRRKTVESEKKDLLRRVADEKKARYEMEYQKKKIEQELEELSTQLFEEAQKMVIAAKEDAQKEQEILHNKNEKLRDQLSNTEILLKLQNDQLAELKAVMEQMHVDREDQNALTAPSSPGFSRFDSKDDETPFSAADESLPEPVSPSYPTSFTHLVQPILRTDLSSYEDFKILVQTTKRLSVRSRPPSGAFGASAMSALGLTAGHSMSPSNASTSSVASTVPTSSSGSLPQTPNTPGSAALSAGSGAAAVPVPPLKDTRFFKRVLSEDIEPTLRLDIAPGLSWLSRRTVINAITEGTLVVEPVPPATPGSLVAITKPQFKECSLCGENRKEEAHLRTYRFRTSDADTAQRYPLCKSYCLVRVRATCDLMGFLRLLKDGHWRTDDEDAVKAAWEESVRLREQMFWARIGGGVVPTTPMLIGKSPMLPEKSPRPSQDGKNEAPQVDQQQSQEPPKPSVEVSSESSDNSTAPAPAETPDTKPEGLGLQNVSLTSPTSETVEEKVARPVTPPPKVSEEQMPPASNTNEADADADGANKQTTPQIPAQQNQ